MDAGVAYTFTYDVAVFSALSEKDYILCELLYGKDALYCYKIMSTQSANFVYTPTSSGTYTWRFRRVHSGANAPASSYTLDNLKVSYVIPYTRTECPETDLAYRFGFNGQEKESDIYGESNAYDFGARIHDARIGRWLSVDPLMKKYPSLTPYHFSNNNPIIYKDDDGKDYSYTVTTNKDKNGVVTKTINVEMVYKVINVSSKGASLADINLAQSYGNQIFDKSTSNPMKYIKADQLQVNVTIKFEQVDNISKVGDNDNVLILADKMNGGGKDVIGWGEEPGSIAMADVNYANDPSSMATLVLHEIGHNLGMEHNESSPRCLMYPNNTKGKVVQSNDIKNVMYEIGADLSKAKDGKNYVKNYNEKGHARKEASNFLRKNASKFDANKAKKAGL